MQKPVMTNLSGFQWHKFRFNFVSQKRRLEPPNTHSFKPDAPLLAKASQGDELIRAEASILN
ncbi:hypothetical protein VIBNISFn27_330023 [Vibrio nigripulchritudo SFn27]|nr:hypothetical protein VIBNISFn27_330023 [Vibrio nigripulchritudo SFn27]